MSENIIDAMQTSTAKPTLHSAASRRARFVVLALALILVGAAAISLLLGRYPIDPAQAVAMLVSKIVPVDPIWTEQQATLFFNVRLPRILLALMVGCCLACAGAAYQGTFQNPLVSPDILGASQGAAFGAAVAILLGVSSFTTSLFAFGFSLFTVLLVLLISSRARGNHMMVVVLAGVMVSSLFQAGVSYAKLVADPTDELADITYWLMGSLTGANMRDSPWCSPSYSSAAPRCSPCAGASTSSPWETTRPPPWA